MKWILCLLTVCLFLGCGTVDVAKVRAQIDSYEQSIPALQAAADQLQALAEQTGKPELVAAAANAQATLKFTQEQIPAMKEELKHLQEQAPWWKIVAAAAWPLVTPLLKLIPGPGGVAATMIAELAYRFNATKSAKDKDDKAHALLTATGTTNAPG